MILWNSNTEPGQPCESSSGIASGLRDGSWMKCRSMPPIGSVNWRKAVELGFPGAPVEAVAPVVEQRLEIGEARAGGPGLERRLVGKARARETLAQIGDGRIGDVKGEASLGSCRSQRAPPSSAFGVDRRRRTSSTFTRRPRSSRLSLWLSVVTATSFFPVHGFQMKQRARAPPHAFALAPEIGHDARPLLIRTCASAWPTRSGSVDS